MRTLIHPESVTLWLSSNDTYNWARKPGAAWPGSDLSGSRVVAVFDSNGLCDLTVDGKSDTNCNVHELAAICADHLARKLPQDHPAYDVAVGQFLAK